jgi:hypothetical protein
MAARSAAVIEAPRKIAKARRGVSVTMVLEQIGDR